jgi:hypothetical protein
MQPKVEWRPGVLRPKYYLYLTLGLQEFAGVRIIPLVYSFDSSCLLARQRHTA